MSLVAELAPLVFEGRSIPLAEGQTVLAALEAAGERVESSCRSGVCQSCLMQVVEGVPPKRAQAGLTAGQIAQGLFMPCVCTPEKPIVIARADSARQRAPARVESLDWLSASVRRVRLRPLAPFVYRPGQFVGLIAEDGLIRSYSIASTPDQAPLVELHVRVIPGGRMSSRLATTTAVGDVLTLSGPSGACCYEGVETDQPLVLAGTGSGLAPLWAVLNDALSRGHRGTIDLYHGASSRQGLYLVDELEALQRDHPGVSYRPLVREPADPEAGDLLRNMMADGVRRDAVHFLCGDAGLVRRMQRGLFLGGARLDRIRADPFAPAAA